MSSITYGSVCSGIEAATVAWEPLGWSPLWLSEIEPFPCALLEHHYPTTINLGDMTCVRDYITNGLIDAPDVLVAGTPCQAFSVAGLRNSLGDNRGQLSLEYVRILNEIDEQRPDDEAITVWENVTGVLTTRDNAFGCLLGALAGEQDALEPSGGKWSHAGCVYGPQRSIAWRVLDAQYFGLAQRRKRVFVVASARKGFDPASVLFESQGVRRDIAPSRESQQNANAFSGGCIGEYKRDVGEEALQVVHGTQDPCVSQELAFALGRNYGQENAVCSSTDTLQVRKLTPTECERLQGFPDGYTTIPYRNKAADACPDGPRYKALGNSMAVPVMRWIGERIQQELTKCV